MTARQIKPVTLTLAITSGHVGRIGAGAKFTGKCESQSNRTIQVTADYSLFPKDSRIPMPGDIWIVTGEFAQNPYGPDRPDILRAKHCELLPVEGKMLRHFLAHNKAFRDIGFGESKIDALMKHFAAYEDNYNTLIKALNSGRIELFTGHDLLTTTMAAKLLLAWRAVDRDEIELIIYLQSKGFDTSIGNKIRRVWGKKAIDYLEANPYYLLALAGWENTDSVARNNYNIALDDPRRQVAAVLAHMNHSLTEKQHTLVDHDNLMYGVRKRLKGHCSPKDAIAMAVGKNKRILTGNAQTGYQLAGAAWLEYRVRKALLDIYEGKRIGTEKYQVTELTDEYINRMISKCEVDQGFEFNKDQKAAIRMAVKYPVSVICGGAGVGKTTVLNAILRILDDTGQPFFQMALAGRAAKRMEHTTKKAATTIASFIHRIESQKITIKNNPVIIIDESSMLDLPTMDRIIRNIPSNQPVRFLFVGDQHQLPPINFGLIFHRLVESNIIPRTQLIEVKRSDDTTGIPKVVQAIRDKIAPGKDLIPAYTGNKPGVSFYECREDQITAAIMEILHDDLGGLVDGDAVQILSIRNDDVGGVDTINRALQDKADDLARKQGFERPTLVVLEPTTVVGDIELGGIRYAVGDPVMFLENDIPRRLNNGTLGVVVDIVDDQLVCEFEGDEHYIGEADFDKITLAYSITVYKAQGSEFQRVIIPIVKSKRLLDRSMIYTASTRGRVQIIFVGSRELFEEVIPQKTKIELRKVGLSF